MRYQKVFIQIWNDEKFTTLSPSAQRFFFYCLTSPMSNLIGLYPLKSGYACEDLKCSAKDLAKDLTECLEKDLIKYDFATQIIWVKNYLKHNPITNPNQVKAGSNALRSLPKTFLKQDFKEYLEGLNEGLCKGLLDVLLYTVTDTDTVKKERIVKENQKKLFLKFVYLSEKEHRELINQFGEGKTEDFIQSLNGHIGSKGDKYKSHYHTILNWERKDRKKMVGSEISLDSAGRELKYL